MVEAEWGAKPPRQALFYISNQDCSNWYLDLILRSAANYLAHTHSSCTQLWLSDVIPDILGLTFQLLNEVEVWVVSVFIALYICQYKAIVLEKYWKIKTECSHPSMIWFVFYNNNIIKTKKQTNKQKTLVVLDKGVGWSALHLHLA